MSKWQSEVDSIDGATIRNSPEDVTSLDDVTLRSEAESKGPYGDK